MKKSLYIHIFYCLFRFSDTICATQNNDDQDEEQLYIIEIFNANPSQKKYTKARWYSSPTEEGFVFIVSSKITWNKLKHIIYTEIGTEIENRFFCPVYGTLNLPTLRKQIITPEQYEHTFYKLLESKKPLWNLPSLFDSVDFMGLKKDIRYKIAAKKFSSRIKRLEANETLGKSMIAWLGDNSFKLISIDDYHKWRKDPSTISLSELSPEPDQDFIPIDENEYSPELPPEANIPQLTQIDLPNQSSSVLTTQNILVLPVVAGASIWAGRKRLFSRQKIDKPEEEKTIQDNTAPEEIIVAY